MMKKELSEEEILTLHQFCDRHYVRHYDVRLELVDHLASSIEAVWEKDESVAFWDALNKIYSGYGPTGFRSLVREKEEAMEKAFNKAFNQFLADMFRWPKVIVLFAWMCLCAWFYGFYGKGDPVIPSIFTSVSCTVSFLLDISLSSAFIIKRRQVKQPLICIENYIGFVPAGILLYIIIPSVGTFLIDGDLLSARPYSQPLFIIYNAIAILCGLAAIARYKLISDKLKKARQTYPLAFK